MAHTFCLKAHLVPLLTVVNLFCNYKPLGGVGTFLLVPEVTHFHPSPSPVVSLTLMVGVDAACFSVAGGGWGSSNCWIPEKMLSTMKLIWYYPACSLSPTTPSHGTTAHSKQHTSCRTEGHLCQPRREAVGTPCSFKCCAYLPKPCLHQTLYPSRGSCSNICWWNCPVACHHHIWDCLHWKISSWVSLHSNLLQKLLHLIVVPWAWLLYRPRPSTG